ncbi:hypothetical protein CEXT_558301 [Caerostris extrusa]|uniref:Uncharacterized protein n=1 Tax=Caerostris extrusa TaxID=172846 RepID=A0AAV4WCQ5_CAEEX|nr:hypothetical protein CEXT_558301 [Caerostris extrusa]
MDQCVVDAWQTVINSARENKQWTIYFGRLDKVRASTNVGNDSDTCTRDTFVERRLRFLINGWNGMFSFSFSRQENKHVLR